jgi:hypothetical protein
MDYQGITRNAEEGAAAIRAKFPGHRSACGCDMHRAAFALDDVAAIGREHGAALDVCRAALDPQNQNVTNGDLVPAIRDVAQVALAWEGIAEQIVQYIKQYAPHDDDCRKPVNSVASDACDCWRARFLALADA